MKGGKRIPALLLAAVLLLSLGGCAVPETPGADPAAATAQPTEAQTEPSPEATEPTEATEPAGPTELTVVTDASGYHPHAAPAAQYTRLRDEPIEDFIPGDYGAVYPFAGAPHYLSWQEGDNYVGGYSYGFVTADGCIICDPVYVSVESLNAPDLMSETEQHVPAWRVCRTENVKKAEDELWGEWYDGDTLYGAVAMDGSFFLPCSYTSIIARGDVLIAMRGWSPCCFELYDARGRLLFTDAALPAEAWGADYYSFAVGEGIICVNAEFYVDETKTLSYALDYGGRLLFGPLQDLGPFSEGLARAYSAADDAYGYVDRSGSWVIAPQYRWCNEFQYGLARVITSYDSYDGMDRLIDKTGETVLYEDDPTVFRVGDRTMIVCTTARDGYALYDADGTLVQSEAHGDYEFFEPAMLVRTQSTGVWLTSLESGETSFFAGYPNVWWYNQVELRFNGERCCLLVNWDTERCALVSAALEIVLEHEGGNVYPDFDDFTGEALLCLNRQNGQSCEYVRGDGSTVYRSRNGEGVRICGDRILIRTDDAARMLDASGAEVFCYPIPRWLAE